MLKIISLAFLILVIGLANAQTENQVVISDAAFSADSTGEVEVVLIPASGMTFRGALVQLLIPKELEIVGLSSPDGDVMYGGKKDSLSGYLHSFVFIGSTKAVLTLKSNNTRPGDYVLSSGVINQMNYEEGNVPAEVLSARVTITGTTSSKTPSRTPLEAQIPTPTPKEEKEKYQTTVQSDVKLPPAEPAPPERLGEPFPERGVFFIILIAVLLVLVEGTIRYRKKKKEIG